MTHPPVDETPRVAPREPGDPLPQYLLYRRHLYAYETAAGKISKGGSCLDIGAGLGYGLSLLADRAETATALDLSDVALQRLPGLANLEKIKGNATELPFESATFDSVVAFQLIEHVAREDAVRVVLEMRRVLRPGGKAFITTPNSRWRLLPGQRPQNPHHLHEFTPRDIARFAQQVGGGKSRLSGVVGKNGAQEIERARVAPSILKAYGWLPGRVLSRARKRLRARTGKRVDRLATVEDTEADWFELTSRFGHGLDFFLELER